MATGSINIIERHIEKVVLGLAGVFLLAMVFMYLIRSPNKIDYNSQLVGPNELGEVIQRDATSLREAINRAQPGETQVLHYAQALQERHNDGIFSTVQDAPALSSKLCRSAGFGQPIPDFTEEEEVSGDIVLVTPLEPTAPVLRTGRSLVIRRRPIIGNTLPGSQPPVDDDEDLSALEAEMPWVSVASYYSYKAQRDAMSRAKYAPYRSKVYIVGLDVQRQEMLASGEYSAWQDVDNSRAMPQLDVPKPELDEQSGTIANKNEIDRAYDLVQSNQARLMQPAFYDTLAGDPWKMPALEGYPDQEEDDVARRPDRSEDEPVVAAVPQRSTPGPSGRSARGGRSPRVRPSGADRTSTAGGGESGRDKAKEDLKAAREAYMNEDDNQALTLAQRVIDNPDARPGDIRLASGIIKSIQNARGMKERRQAIRPVGVSGVRSVGTSRGAEEPMPIVTHPDDTERLAVWFHDDTVESGKTYRYRMRVKLWNRYWGKMKALKDPGQAKHTVLVGDWSLPSDSITVTPSTHFFVSSATPNKDAARVDVYKWRQGDWLKESFTVSVGDVIGGTAQVDTGILDRKTLSEIRADVDFNTGAVVLDLRFDEPVVTRDSAGKKGEFRLREKDSLVLVYLDPADGQVKERAQVFDRRNPLRNRLEPHER